MGEFLTVNVQPCRWAQPPVGQVLSDAGVVCPVLLSHLNDDQVAIRGLDVIWIPLRLDLNPILEPVDLEYME